VRYGGVCLSVCVSEVIERVRGGISRVEAHIVAYKIFWRILVAEIERC
jgi:hypothetical protein